MKQFKAFKADYGEILMEHEFKTVGIVGLGLIGGSAAKAIKKNTHCSLLAFDISQESMQSAYKAGIVSGDLNADTIPSCDLILIAITPEKIIEWVRSNAKYIQSNTILVDLCGVKRTVMDKLIPISEEFGFKYVGGHPMAGKEVAGFENSTSELFKNASMILAPLPSTQDTELKRLTAFFEQMGFSTVVISDKDEHDRIIAYTSQLAHITSSAYIKSPTARSYMGFSAGSYKDMTRVARLDPKMWTELCMDNADNLENELSLLISSLNEYLDALKKRNDEKLETLFEDGLKIKLSEKDEDVK